MDPLAASAVWRIEGLKEKLVGDMLRPPPIAEAMRPHGSFLFTMPESARAAGQRYP